MSWTLWHRRSIKKKDKSQDTHTDVICGIVDRCPQSTKVRRQTHLSSVKSHYTVYSVRQNAMLASCHTADSAQRNSLTLITGRLSRCATHSGPYLSFEAATRKPLLSCSRTAMANQAAKPAFWFCPSSRAVWLLSNRRAESGRLTRSACEMYLHQSTQNAGKGT